MGGFLLDVWRPGLFLVAAVAVVACTAVAGRGLRTYRDTAISRSEEQPGDTARVLLGLLRDRDIARLIGATTLWNFALRGLKAFVVLFFTVGLHRSATFVSAVIFPLVALGLVAAVPAVGKLAERVGHPWVLMSAAAVYGVGLLLAGVWQTAWMIAVIPIPAAAAGVVRP